MTYIPDRGDVIWLDFEPTKGKEIGKYRPALVLSSADYQKTTNLVIVVPVSTSIRGSVFEVPLEGMEQRSVIVSNIVQTLSWKERKARYISKVDDDTMVDVLHRLLPLLGSDLVL